MSALLRKQLKRFASITSGPARVESSEVESTYVPKPRYHHKRKSRTLVRWFTYITGDLQRLTGITLIVVLVCGLGTVALLNLLGPRADQPVIINEAPARDDEAAVPDDSSLSPQSDPQSSTQDQQLPSPSETSDASFERSRFEQNRNDHGLRVDNIEPSKRLPVVKPVAKSSNRLDGLDQKEAKTRKRETPAAQRAARSTEYPSGSPASISSTNVVRAEKGDASRAKAVPSTLATKPSITQRPRRVAGKNDRAVPVATSEKNGKAKVIQWP